MGDSIYLVDRHRELLLARGERHYLGEGAGIAVESAPTRLSVDFRSSDANTKSASLVLLFGSETVIGVKAELAISTGRATKLDLHLIYRPTARLRIIFSRCDTIFAAPAESIATMRVSLAVPTVRRLVAGLATSNVTGKVT